MNLLTLNFQQNSPVRVIEIDGELHWVAKDVCLALDYTWTGTQRIGHIPEEWRRVTSVVTPSGRQEMAVLSESGLYFFLARSDKPRALQFQKWIAGEILPSIRKTGVYLDQSHAAVKAAQHDMFEQEDTAASTAKAFTAHDELTLLRQMTKLQARVLELLDEKLKPKPVRKPKRPLTDEVIRLARQLKAEGMGQADIARQLGISESSVSLVTRALH